MIQINLLPDVKQELIRAQRVRNYVISIAILIGFASVGVVVLMALLVAGQVVRDRIADARIDEEYQKLTTTEDLSEMVTIQNQLTKISGLQATRSKDSRLFDVLNAINPPAPNNVQFSSVKIDPLDGTMTIEGTAGGGYPAVETFKKSLLNAKLSIQDANGTSETELISDVTDESSSLGEDSSGTQVVRFSMTLEYTAGLFDNSVQKAEIVLPKGRVDVTDSRQGVPASLFTEPASDVEEGN